MVEEATGAFRFQFFMQVARIPPGRHLLSVRALFQFGMQCRISEWAIRIMSGWNTTKEAYEEHRGNDEQLSVLRASQAVLIECYSSLKSATAESLRRHSVFQSRGVLGRSH
jgi:hypothetical protein